MQFVARILGLVASIGTVALTTRSLGPGPYGQLSAAIMFIGLWSSLTELGIGAVIVRRVTSGTGDLSRLVRVNAGFSLTYCLPLGAVASLTGWLLYRDDPLVVGMIAIVSGSLALTTLGSCVQPVFVTDVRFGAVALSDLVGRLLSFGLTFVLVHVGADLYWYAVVQLVPPLAVLVIQGGVARRIVDIRPIFSVRESWELVRESLPQTGVLVIAALYWRSDGVLLSVLSTKEETGAYNLAYTVAFNATVISSVFLWSTLSTMTNLFATDRERFARFTERSIQAMLFVSMPLAVVGVLLAPELVRLLGSEDFVAAGGGTLGLLFVAVAIRLVTGTLSQGLFAAHDQVFLLRLNIVSLVLNIGLNVALIPQFGAKGAAASLVASEFFGLAVATWRLTGRTPYRTPWLFLVRLAPPVAAAAAVCFVGNSLPVLLTGALAAVVYVAVNLLLGPVRLNAARGLLSSEGGTP
ncbi:flippase [Tsukamurella tyrosinosolvens]|uniref:flippase n=1 Tax=Tsukamurella tyrosinosolvens TaxID=57704 RepID=UPI0009EE1281|nr:flippase [Tsukamurella tyrosinosolvens]MCA4997400.1 flippase [Tsukamurella tyrosinosolvens]WEL93385.1 flippase [Tsukamurella tyrosinosolvens]